MNIAKIEESLHQLVKNYSEEAFIYSLLAIYGKPKSSLTRLKSGTYNLSKDKNEILWKKNLFFKKITNVDLHSSIDQIRHDASILKHNPRFIIVTDYVTLLAVDIKNNETLDIKISDLPKSFDFFLPWAGMEKSQHKNENPADVKAAERMAKLYDHIRQDNLDQDSNSIHSLNVFLSRLLFCFFAEDTGIFKASAFTNAVASHTLENGSDLDQYLDKFFEVLNRKERSSYPLYLQAFPYVNGGLFAKRFSSPKFSLKSRKIIIECGELDWSAINPDIFGSMIQAVVDPEQRGGMGMHYTSVSNIMKVIEPLFLNKLYDDFDKYQGDYKKLEKLLGRLSKIKIFDPACGSGNFLIIAYKELRKLEMKIFKQLKKVSPQQLLPISSIHLIQFYGIELDDFAHEIAMLSLWLAEHQMNLVFKEEFGEANPSLPLKQGGNITCDNAAKIDWKEVCPFNENDEVYLLGNPPYLGSRYQDFTHKEDMKHVFTNNYKSLDYVACWYKKGAEYIKNSNNKLAFVSTNSICQGEQVALLWPLVLEDDLEIFFAHTSFKWTNNAKGNAGVICVIVGLRNKEAGKKLLYSENRYLAVDNINPYLTEGSVIYIHRRSKPLTLNMPPMVYGNLLNDGGNLVLSTEEKEDITKKHPNSKKYIKSYIGSKEFLRGEERWCLYIADEDVNEARKIKEICDRLDRITKLRSESTEKSTRALAPHPNRYYFSAHQESASLFIPRTSSDRREYIPIGFFDGKTIIGDAQAIYNAEPHVFGIISSRMHVIWVRALAGRLKNDYRYSSALCYNTFPLPDLSDHQKQTVATNVFNILSERENHSEKTIAQLYDPIKMPIGLREAHRGLDIVIERCYRSKPFESDEERLECLFKLYEEMICKKHEGKSNA